ncbi:MAG TPA: hypothetical protein VN757_03330 [Steroidobacteraceae bacterium]|nr:hypothetical protein [Steroidobacteraceae bacterium]
MPKKPRADKKTRARIDPEKGRFRKTPASINDLLARRPALKALAARIPEQQAWVDWLRTVVPLELAAHIVNVVPKALGTAAGRVELVVLADSPAWCARLRFALAALEAQISARDAAVQHTRVRVALS